MIAKILYAVKRYRRDIFLAICLLLIAGIGYNLGHINALGKTPAPAQKDTIVWQNNGVNPEVTATGQTAPTQTAGHTDLQVVASKNSKSKVYHYTWCSGAQRIKEINKVWFDTAAEAEAAGYSLAGNCN